MKLETISTGACIREGQVYEVEIRFFGIGEDGSIMNHFVMVNMPLTWNPRVFLAAIYMLAKTEFDDVFIIEPVEPYAAELSINKVYRFYTVPNFVRTLKTSYEYQCLIQGGEHV